ncbi:MFS transporter [Rubrivivax gelatinosus]|uniref:Major facilitator superfamily MFS_1 n=1 Tax=Rubrivivax gelatinosus (strain NBRC 100245 / IL144) TaxID=983917 RepID=I0HN82_RUBGI|nr:hypothetical protein [Rubrivivax gelatinosus]BAL94469.1 major facilitator superfamily MFS_1 [Rubrivivax gelatinosus IL144]
MDGERRRHELSAAEVAAALAVGSVALLVLGLMPILLGELLSARRLSLEGLGIVAMAEIVSLGLGVLLGDLLLPLTRLRLVTVVAAAVAGGLDLGTLQASGDAGFALLRAGAGLAEGALVWATTAVIVRCPNPDRDAGIFFVMQTAAQALLGFTLARSVIPAHGWQGAYVVLAALVVVPMFAAAALPRALAPLASAAHTGFRWTAHTALPLLAIFLQMATLSSLWSYVEPLGQQAGFSGPQVQTLIAAALVVQMAGGLSGSALVRHLAPAPTLLAASALLGLVALGVSGTGGGASLAFALLCTAFAFTWLFMTPYQTGLAFVADGSGRVASLAPVAQLLGVAAGPLAASLLVDGDEVAAVPWVSAGCAAAAVLVLAAIVARHPRDRVFTQV